MADNANGRLELGLLRNLVHQLQCFSIIEPAPDLTRQHEVLYASFSIQRTRLLFWAHHLRSYLEGKAPLTESCIEQLRSICGILIPKAKTLDSSGLEPLQTSQPHASASRGLEIFRRTFLLSIKQLRAHPDLQCSADIPQMQVCDISRFSHYMSSLAKALDDLFDSAWNEQDYVATSWRECFYQEMSTVAEDLDSLVLLADARLGSHDIFADLASQRLLEREGRLRPTLLNRYRTFEDITNRIIFDTWHKILHRLLPESLLISSSSAADTTSAQTSQDIFKAERAPQYLAFRCSLGGRTSDLAEIDLSHVKCDDQLRQIRLIQFKTTGGKIKVLARDSVPPQWELVNKRYSIGNTHAPPAKQKPSTPPSQANKIFKLHSDEEKQLDLSVAQSGQQIYNKLFARRRKSQDPAGVIQYLPRNLGSSLLSPEAGSSIGWGIEIVLGPSLLYTFLQLIPLFAFIIISPIGKILMAWIIFLGNRAFNKNWDLGIVQHVRKESLSSTDWYLITAASFFLIFGFVKAARMMET
ncbi:MAG: hypothetical protein Q9218_008076 [Villophora microphyllina]